MRKLPFIYQVIDNKQLVNGSLRELHFRKQSPATEGRGLTGFPAANFAPFQQAIPAGLPGGSSSVSVLRHSIGLTCW
jgi:hypothetical protein